MTDKTIPEGLKSKIGDMAAGNTQDGPIDNDGHRLGNQECPHLSRVAA